MKKKKLIKHIGGIETHLKDIEERALEFQVVHARIEVQKRVLECLVESLEDAIPEETRVRLAACLASDNYADQCARLKGKQDLRIQQLAQRIADFRAVVERMPDE